jgi:predicted amidohydrolase
VTLEVATSYFPVSGDIRSNAGWVLRHMRIAKERGAHVIHFPEACLSGYAGVDLRSHQGLNWRLLEHYTHQLIDAAGTIGIWVILGSVHRLSGANEPHNSAYIISDRGQIVDRYDKRFCAGPASGRSGDLAHYTPGEHFSVFTIKGIRCGAAICHDCRYPEVYRQYARMRVRLMFQSFHAGNMSSSRWTGMREVTSGFEKLNAASTLPGIVFPATVQSMAANNFMWVSCSNSSAKESCFGAFFARPDGVITGRLRRNVAGVLISTVDTREDLYDSTRAWRDRAIDGTYHSGQLPGDKRSRIRTEV